MTAADEFFGLLEGAAAEDPQDVLRRQCEAWVTAATELRFAPDRWPSAQASPWNVAEALVTVRSRLDGVEAYLGNAMALRAATAAQAKHLEQAADDAWDGQADEERRSRRPRPEWQGAKERYAYWNLAIRPQRALAREARELADYVRDAYDRIKLAYDGLDGTRRDLNARLTHLRWETNQEQ